MKKYISVEENTRTGYRCYKLFYTKEEASADARIKWDQLTNRERKHILCYSAEICFDGCEVDDDGNVDWDLFSNIYDYPGCFDSNVWYAVICTENGEWDEGSHVLSEAIDLALEIGFTDTDSGEIEIAKIDVEESFCDGVYYIDSDGNIEFKE